ncbi:MAG: hypothetical protein ACHQIG_00830 [Acidimicrobiia bacterium]
MTTTTELVRNLSDPVPPVPGAEVRDAVHARAASIVRRRRVARGAVTAIACIALLAVGVIALADRGSGSRGSVEAAAGPADAQVSVRARGGAVPPGVELDVTLVGEGGTYHAHVRTPGTLTLAAVPPGDYELRWEWTSDDGTAAAAGHVPVHLDTGDLTLTL